MLTHIADEIVEVLYADGGQLAAARTDLLHEVLAPRWWWCPGCRRLGDAQLEPSVAVLYTRYGWAGGFSGESTMEGYQPDEWTLIAWQVRRHHPGCVIDLVYDITPAGTRRPDTAPPGVRPPEQMASMAPEPGRWWFTVIPVVGLPVIVRQPKAAQLAVATVGRDSAERVVEQHTTMMINYGARRLSPANRHLDAIGDLPPAPGWYCQIPHPSMITVWAPPLDDGADDRLALLTWSGPVPFDWALAVATHRRVLLITVPADTVDTTVTDPAIWAHPDLQAALQDRAAAVMMRAGMDPDEPATAAPPSRRGPALRPIDVRDLWQNARAHARSLITADDPGPQHAVPGAVDDACDVLARVLTAEVRAGAGTVTSADLTHVARLLSLSDERHAFEHVMLAATNLHELTPPGRTRYDTVADWPLKVARAAVHRRWLDERGAPRPGDTVLVLPDDAGQHRGYRAVVTGLNAITWWEAARTGRIWEDYDLSTADPAGRDRGLPERRYNLLLADTGDPRAAAQAAFSALVDLDLLTTMGHQNESWDLGRLQRRIDLHTGTVRRLYRTLLDTPTTELPQALAAAAATLLRAYPHAAPPT